MVSLPEPNHDNEEFISLLMQKWMQYFNSCKKRNFFSELLINTEYFFAIPSHNGNTGQKREISCWLSIWKAFCWCSITLSISHAKFPQISQLQLLKAICSSAQKHHL